MLSICAQSFLFSLYAVLPFRYSYGRGVSFFGLETFVLFEYTTDCSGSDSCVTIVCEDVSPGECHFSIDDDDAGDDGERGRDKGERDVWNLIDGGDGAVLMVDW